MVTKKALTPNAGSRWVEEVSNYLKEYCNGVPLKSIQKYFFSEMNIMPDKTSSIVAQLYKIGIIRIENDLYYWINDDTDSPIKKQDEPKNESTEEIIGRERREKMISPDVEEEEKTPKLETMYELKARRYIEYQEYRKHTEHLKREPKIYEDWLQEKNRIEEVDEQKRLKELENKES